ncbi:MAG: T9SS type A sorting domain-containing protein [Fidelibacterota bacterium]|nr:MAG: T9SS type A sorting domain-containing protein [Candidatus Neomarinimicrobiota bacterium]
MKPCNKRLPALLVIAVVAVSLVGVASAQPRIVQVAPTAFGILNDTIAADTTATGERVDSSTVYELERGADAYYTLNGTIEHSGYHLTIVAEDGDGPRPKLVPGIISGGEASRCFRARGDLTLKGLYLTDVDQEGSIFSDKNIVRASGEGTRIVIDDCHFNGDHQSFIRLDSHHQSYYITNSTFSWSVDNGRGFDRRGNITDTLVVENCTFYNIISKVMREGGSGYVKYMKWDHCTFYNVGEEFMEFEQVGELIFTNNLVVNTGFLGECAFYEDPVAPLMEGIVPVVHEELDSLLTLEGKTQTIEFRNNNFYLDPAIVAAHAALTIGDSLVNAGGVVQRAVFDSLGLTLVDTSTMTREAITFTDAPILDTTLSIIKTVWEEYAGESDYQSPFDHGGVGGYGETGFGTMPFDFTYPTTTASYTAGDGNTPLGDLNWFPEFLAVEGREELVPEGFTLSQNYPNPFNPATMIRYELPHAADVELMVYNLLGKEVVRLKSGHQGAGSYEVQWDGHDASGNLLSSGVYFYRLKAEGFTQTRKMLFLR